MTTRAKSQISLISLSDDDSHASLSHTHTHTLSLSRHTQSDQDKAKAEQKVHASNVYQTWSEINKQKKREREAWKQNKRRKTCFYGLGVSLFRIDNKAFAKEPIIGERSMWRRIQNLVQGIWYIYARW